MDRGVNSSAGHTSGIIKVIQDKGDKTFLEPFGNGMDQRIHWNYQES